MKKYQVVLEVEILKDWADISDFEEEIGKFNWANRGIIVASIKKLKEV